jgi:predicted O-methyltransferase YrrM
MSFYGIENTVLTGKGDSDKHLLTLYSIAIGMGAQRILELGVRGGSTTLPLLMAAQKTGGMLTSVDIEDTKFVPPSALASTPWKFVKQDALAFLRAQQPTEPYDLIFIDDWHAYDHVKQELVEIDRLVSPRTVILVHDLMYGNTCPHYHSDLTLKDGQWANGGPYRAVAELPSQFWEFATLPYNNGLTLLRKKYSNRYFQ